VPGHDPRRVALGRHHRRRALLLGADKRSATEFSFFLAMPTMAGAFAYDLYKNWAILAPETSRHRARLRRLLHRRRRRRALSARFRQPHGFAPFAWWRILVGGMGLGALAVCGRAWGWVGWLER
jgi:undecaprenyl-diphosphatase